MFQSVKEFEQSERFRQLSSVPRNFFTRWPDDYQNLAMPDRRADALYV
jgi:hypothetical protein